MKILTPVTIQKIINAIHQFHDSQSDLSEVEKVVYAALYQEGIWNKNIFDLTFPIFLAYFFDPTKKANEILCEKGIDRKNLLEAHRMIQKSSAIKEIMTSNYYPRPLLVKAAINLLKFLNQHPDFLPKILCGKTAGPMMLEIHPTDANCIYRCKMCLWCGGQGCEKTVAELYGSDRQLLTADDWHQILKDAKTLGTQQIIFSGGGETLLAKEKVGAVLKIANNLGFSTMIYTNGRLLKNLPPPLMDSILNSTWLRISCHAATPDTYAKIVNRPPEANDLEAVKKGILLVLSLRNKREKALKVGLGIVLQKDNYSQIPDVVNLCSQMSVDFLDIRVDCIGITNELSPSQKELMFKNLRWLREETEKKHLGFAVSFADDLIIAMDCWQGLELTKPTNCRIPLIRPAIDPYGVVAACDSIGEPYTRSQSPKEYVLGEISADRGFKDIMLTSNKKLGILCPHCMPGQISLNALIEKVLSDTEIGFGPSTQPFFFTQG